MGVGVFYGCKKLTSVEANSFPLLTTMGDSVFRDCHKLTAVHANSFPALTEMGSSVFWDCKNLTAVEANSFPLLTEMGSYVFAWCTSMTAVHANSFPALTEMGSSVFFRCKNLTAVEANSFPALTTMGSEVFYECEKLTQAEFPLLASAGEKSFRGCKRLALLGLPGDVRLPGSDVFDGCTKLHALAGSTKQGDVVKAFSMTPLMRWCACDGRDPGLLALEGGGGAGGKEGDPGDGGGDEVGGNPGEGKGGGPGEEDGGEDGGEGASYLVLFLYGPTRGLESRSMQSAPGGRPGSLCPPPHLLAVAADFSLHDQFSPPRDLYLVAVTPVSASFVLLGVVTRPRVDLVSSALS